MPSDVRSKGPLQGNRSVSPEEVADASLSDLPLLYESGSNRPHTGATRLAVDPSKHPYYMGKPLIVVSAPPSVNNANLAVSTYPSQRPAARASPRDEASGAQQKHDNVFAEVRPESPAMSTPPAEMTSPSLLSSPAALQFSPTLPQPRDDSLCYTWTDSYLDESASATKMRWLEHQTFGPVLQSEGEASSSAQSTSLAPLNPEAVWGVLRARNGSPRLPHIGAASDLRRERRREPYNRRTAGGAALRRFDLTTAERGSPALGCSPGRAGKDGATGNNTAFRTGKVILDASPCSSQARRFSLDASRTPSATWSEASVALATVQRPRPNVPIAPISRLRSPQRECPLRVKGKTVMEAPRSAVEVEVAPPQTADFLNMVASSLSPFPLTESPTSSGNSARLSQPSSTRNIDAADTGPSHLLISSPNASFAESDTLNCSCVDTLLHQCQETATFRNAAPPRGRALKAIYED